MATSDSREVVIEASPEEILDRHRPDVPPRGHADVVPPYQKSEVLEAKYEPNGRPKRVKMKIRPRAILREQVLGVTPGRADMVSWNPDQCGSTKAQGCPVLHADNLTATIRNVMVRLITRPGRSVVPGFRASSARCKGWRLEDTANLRGLPVSRC